MHMKQLKILKLYHVLLHLVWCDWLLKIIFCPRYIVFLQSLPWERYRSVTAHAGNPATRLAGVGSFYYCSSVQVLGRKISVGCAPLNSFFCCRRLFLHRVLCRINHCTLSLETIVFLHLLSDFFLYVLS